MGTNQIIILSNNPMVLERHRGAQEVKGALMDVLYQARDMVHAGHSLYTHPLAGSIKPNETPYKTIVMTAKPKRLDYDSLHLIENAIDTSQAMLADRPLSEMGIRVLKDFQMIDHCILETALNEIPL